MNGPPWIAALLVLGGCASTYREPVLDPRHPASPAAEEAGTPALSRTLDVGAAEAVAPAPADEGAGQGGHSHPDVGAHASSQAPAPDAKNGAHTHGSSDAASGAYECPMHPEVKSDKPEERCPKCGMKTTRKTTQGGQP